MEWLDAFWAVLRKMKLEKHSWKVVCRKSMCLSLLPSVSSPKFLWVGPRIWRSLFCSYSCSRVSSAAFLGEWKFTRVKEIITDRQGHLIACLVMKKINYSPFCIISGLCSRQVFGDNTVWVIYSILWNRRRAKMPYSVTWSTWCAAVSIGNKNICYSKGSYFKIKSRVIFCA